jgi:hypothetical protein
MDIERMERTIKRCIKDERVQSRWMSCMWDSYPPSQFYGLIRGERYVNLPDAIYDGHSIDLELIFTAILGTCSTFSEMITEEFPLDKADLIEFKIACCTDDEEHERYLKEKYDLSRWNPSEKILKKLIKPTKWVYKYEDITHWIPVGNELPLDEDF